MLTDCQFCCRNGFKGRYTFLDLTKAKAGTNSGRTK